MLKFNNQRRVWNTPRPYDGAFCENSQQLNIVNYFRKKLRHRFLTGSLITLLQVLLFFNTAVGNEMVNNTGELMAVCLLLFVNFVKVDAQQKFLFKQNPALRKRCPYLELFWSAFSRILTEYRYWVFLRIQFEWRKMRTRITPNTCTFYTLQRTNMCLKGKYSSR